MRKLALAILSLVVTFGVFQLVTMGSVAKAMKDCPMGSVCPADYESAQWLGSVITPALALLAVFIAVFSVVLPQAPRRAYLPPLSIFTDSGPPALRSVFKKE